MTRRPRRPTREEIELWGRVTETVAPLAPSPTTLTAAAAAEPEKAPPKPKPPAARAAVPQARPPEPKAPPALATLDKRPRSRISRGVTAIDGRIDLHGLTQAAAESSLKHFLREAQADGAKVVLVITGKGTEGSSGERGILRRMTPHWLSSPALREVVVGFEEAARGHGGSGALYVRIRRLR